MPSMGFVRGMLRLAPIGIGALVLAAPAAAQAPGVTYDPDSPAGREYALPLDTARRAADARPSERRNDRSALFGEGVEADPALAASGASGKGSGGTATGRGKQSDGGNARPRAARPEASPHSAPSPVTVRDRGGVAPARTGGAIAIGAIAITLATGLLLRRLRRQPLSRS
jgi:hypothetical protein